MRVNLLACGVLAGPVFFASLPYRRCAAPRLRRASPPGELAGIRPAWVGAECQLRAHRHTGHFIWAGRDDPWCADSGVGSP